MPRGGFRPGIRVSIRGRQYTVKPGKEKRKRQRKKEGRNEKDPPK
jgi:hypothetical protein